MRRGFLDRFKSFLVRLNKKEKNNMRLGEPKVINKEEEVARFAEKTRVWLMTSDGQSSAKESLAKAMKTANKIYEAAKLKPDDFCNPITL